MLFFSCALTPLMLQRRLLFILKDGNLRVEWAVAPMPFERKTKRRIRLRGRLRLGRGLRAR
jgi:hypothetical protein